GVNRDAHGVMSGGSGAEQRPVDHVGDPGQRVPVPGVGRGRRPGDSAAGESRPDVGVVEDVDAVVVADEPVRQRRRIRRDRRPRRAIRREGARRDGAGGTPDHGRPPHRGRLYAGGRPARRAPSGILGAMGRGERAKEALTCTALAVATAVAYAPVLRGTFLTY